MKKPILIKVLSSITGLLLLYSVLGFVIIPKVLTSQLPSLAKEHLNRDLQLDNLQFNPFSMELDIKGFKVKKIEGNAFFNFQRFYINVSVLQSIADLTLTIEKILLNQPNLFVIRDKQGVLNFNDILERLKSDEQEEQKDQDDSADEPFPVTILQMAISDGKLGWKDDFYSNAQKEDIHPINLSIDNFTTVPKKQSQLDIVIAITSGGRLEWQGEIELFPFSSTGHIKLVEIDFHRIWELFLQDDVKFDLVNGTETFEADYELGDSDKGMQLLVKNAHLNIHNFQLAEKGSDDQLISVPNFKISGIALNLLEKTVGIQKVSATDAQFKAWLNADGDINYQTLFSSGTEDAQSTPITKDATSNDEQAWDVSIKHLAFDNFSFNFVDNSLPTPAIINISSLALNVNDIDIKPGTSLPFTLNLKVNKTGSLSLEGQTVLDPFSGNINIKANDLAIKNFQPYIDSAIKLDVISGNVNIETAVSLAQEPDKPLAISLKGNGNINNLVTRDQITHKDFLNWKQLSIENMDLNLAENSYIIDKIKLDKLYTKVLIRKDKSMNIDDLVVESDKATNETTTETKQPKTKEQAVKYNIKQIEFTDSSTDFSDLSLILPFSAHINRLKGSVRGVSSEKNTTTKINLNGRVANLAPVKIKGRINPDKGNSEITLDFKSMPLPIVTPYMAEFAGRKIEKGNMSLELKYKILNNKLTSTNNLLIDQLVLGDKVENPEAVSLPLDLAIALLEDSSGKITLNVPITGSLDDPDFSVSTIVFDAFVNVITKIISSPFNAIASLIGDSEDINQIKFLPGDTSLPVEEQNKLNGIAKALIERPNLNLEIKGTAFSKLDWPSLQSEALDKQLQQIKADQLNEENKKITLARDIVLTDKEYKNLLADLFIQKYPNLAKRSLFGTPQLLDETQGEFYSVAKEKLSAVIPANPQRLKELAKNRAQSIAHYLIEKGIPIEKIFVLDVALDTEESGDAITSIMTLAVN